MSVPLKGHCHTTTSTFFPATAKHKACLRSCHRKRPISREQVPFLFSKTIPMACRAVSCSLGSFHHLKHLAALQHAAAARWEPTVPLLSWATQSWAIPVISLATRKKKKKTHPPASLANARHPIFRETIDYIIFNCTILSTYELFMSDLSDIWMMNSLILPFKYSDCSSKSGSNIPQYLMWLQQSALLAALLWRFLSETRIHFVSRGKPGLSG